MEIMKTRNAYFLVESIFAYAIARGELDLDEKDVVYGKHCDKNGNPLTDEWVEMNLDLNWSFADGRNPYEHEDY